MGRSGILFACYKLENDNSEVLRTKSIREAKGYVVFVLPIGGGGRFMWIHFYTVECTDSEAGVFVRKLSPLTPAQLS